MSKGWKRTVFGRLSNVNRRRRNYYTKRVFNGFRRRKTFYK